MPVIQMHDTVYNIVKTYPLVKDIMVELGFSKITKKVVLESVGRVMTLHKGLQMHHQDIAMVRTIFAKYNFTLEDNHE